MVEKSRLDDMLEQSVAMVKELRLSFFIVGSAMVVVKIQELK